jgi:hypothetical protein
MGALTTPTLAALACLAWAAASPAAAWDRLPPAGATIAVDWQSPEYLPPRYRNHCSYDVHHAAYYCSNHCGLDYQFYYCGDWSFGCCRPGFGYCGWNGTLRCAPAF